MKAWRRRLDPRFFHALLEELTGIRKSRLLAGTAVHIPWLSYVPVPGLALVAVWADPDDPLTRFHAWQGGLLVTLLYVVLVVLGLLARLSDGAAYLATLGLISGLLLLGALAGIIWGIVGAVRKRYFRVRPLWDVLCAMRTAPN